jgi:hypothetical protein
MTPSTNLAVISANALAPNQALRWGFQLPHHGPPNRPCGRCSNSTGSIQPGVMRHGRIRPMATVADATASWCQM